MRSTQYFFAFSLLFSVLAGCMPPTEQPDVQPSHCQNGIRDANERRPDCGGDCLPCQPELECADSENVALFSGLLEGTVTEVFCSKGEDEMAALGTYGTIEFSFNEGDYPESSRKFTMAGCGFPEDGSVCVKVRLKAFPGLDFFANGGTLSVFEEGERFRINFCNVLFSNPNSDVRFYGSVRFYCD